MYFVNRDNGSNVVDVVWDDRVFLVLFRLI